MSNIAIKINAQTMPDNSGVNFPVRVTRFSSSSFPDNDVSVYIFMGKSAKIVPTTVCAGGMKRMEMSGLVFRTLFMYFVVFLIMRLMETGDRQAVCF